MALSTEEINKVNDLYTQLDVLAAENKLLKERTDSSNHDHSDILNRLDDLEELIKDLASKSDKSKK